MLLRHRHLVPEQMDADDVDPRELARALRFIRRINKALAYNKAVVEAIRAEAETLPGQISILDVAAGSGDLLVDLEAASPGRFDLLAIDRHDKTIQFGTSFVAAQHSGVRFLRGDALALPFADASVDVVVSTFFLHHLPEDVAVAALREMARVARHRVVLADLIRSRRAYAWITLFTLFSSRMVKHDARASVAHAFTIDEARTLADRAGLGGATVDRHFGHRFLLTWKRDMEGVTP